MKEGDGSWIKRAEKFARIAAAGIAISGAPGSLAHAKDAKPQTSIETLSEKTKGEIVPPIPIEVRRRNILEEQRHIVGQIRALEKKLGSGGLYNWALKDSSILTAKRLDIILGEISAHLANFNANILWKDEASQSDPFQELIPTTLPQGHVVLRLENTEGEYIRCSAKILRYKKRVFEVTAQHCVVNAKNNLEWRYFPDGPGPDIAVREIDPSTLPEAISIADYKPEEVAEDLSGQLVFLNTIDQFDQRQTAATFIIPMSDAILRSIYPDGHGGINLSEEARMRLDKKYMILLPPWHAMTPEDSEYINASGESGSGLEFPGKISPVGVLTSVMTTVKSYENQSIKTSYSIAFVESSDDLRHLLDVVTKNTKSHLHVHSSYLQTGEPSWSAVVTTEETLE